jgi:hypothetical protein
VMAATGVLPGLGTGRGGECIPLHLTVPRGLGQPDLSSGGHTGEATGGSGAAGTGYWLLASLRAAQATAAAVTRGLVLQPAPSVWSDSGGSGGAEPGVVQDACASVGLFSWRATLGLALLAQALVWQRNGCRAWAGLLRGGASDAVGGPGAGRNAVGLVANSVDSDSDAAAGAGDAASGSGTDASADALRPSQSEGLLSPLADGTPAPAASALIPSPLLSKAARKRLLAAAGGGGRCAGLLAGVCRTLLRSAGGPAGGLGGVRGWVAVALQLCVWFTVTWALRALHALLLRAYDTAAAGAVSGSATDAGAAARGCHTQQSSSEGADSASSSWPLVFALHPAALLLSSYLSLRLVQAAAAAAMAYTQRNAVASGARAAGPEQSRGALSNDAANGAWATETHPGSPTCSSLPALAAALRLLRGVVAPALRVCLLLLLAAVVAQCSVVTVREEATGGGDGAASGPARIADLSQAWVGLQSLLHATALWPPHTSPEAASGGGAGSSSGLRWSWLAVAACVLALHVLFAASLALDSAAAQRERAAAAAARRQSVRLAAQRSQLRRITAGQGRGDRSPTDGRAAHVAGTATRGPAAAPRSAASPTVSPVAPASAADGSAREEALLREGVARCSAELASAATAAARAATRAWAFAASLAAAACLLAWALASSPAGGVSAAGPPDGTPTGAASSVERGASGVAWSAFALCACVATHPALLGAAVSSEALLSDR